MDRRQLAAASITAGNAHVSWVGDRGRGDPPVRPSSRMSSRGGSPAPQQTPGYSQAAQSAWTAAEIMQRTVTELQDAASRGGGTPAHTMSPRQSFGKSPSNGGVARAADGEHVSVHGSSSSIAIGSMAQRAADGDDGDDGSLAIIKASAGRPAASRRSNPRKPAGALVRAGSASAASGMASNAAFIDASPDGRARPSSAASNGGQPLAEELIGGRAAEMAAGEAAGLAREAGFPELNPVYDWGRRGSTPQPRASADVEEVGEAEPESLGRASPFSVALMPHLYRHRLEEQAVHASATVSSSIHETPLGFSAGAAANASTPTPGRRPTSLSKTRYVSTKDLSPRSDGGAPGSGGGAPGSGGGARQPTSSPPTSLQSRPPWVDPRSHYRRSPSGATVAGGSASRRSSLKAAGTAVTLAASGLSPQAIASARLHGAGAHVTTPSHGKPLRSAPSGSGGSGGGGRGGSGGRSGFGNITIARSISVPDMRQALLVAEHGLGFVEVRSRPPCPHDPPVRP